MAFALRCAFQENSDKNKETYNQNDFRQWSGNAFLADPDKLFTNGLAGKQWQTIDYFKDDKVKVRELTALVRSAVDYNLAKVKTTVTTRGTRSEVPKKSVK